MWRQRALLVFLLLLVHQICATNEQEHACPPSSCGKITNITYPFRLKGDPEVCGVNRYWLACENNVTVLYLYSGKYHVQAINYNNFTIRVVDPGVQQPYCSSIPRYFLSPTNFSAIDEGYPYLALQNRDYSWEHVFQHIVFLNCRHAVIDNEKYVETDPCIKWHSKGYIYAIAGDLIAKDFEVGCEVKLVAPTSWWGLDTNNSSYTQMHRALLYGFELSWINFACGDQCGYFYSDCAFDASIQKLQCPCRNFLGGQLFQLQCAKGTWSRLLTSAEEAFNAVIKGLFETINGPNPELEREIGAYDSIFIAFGHYILPYLAASLRIPFSLFTIDYDLSTMTTSFTLCSHSPSRDHSSHSLILIVSHSFQTLAYKIVSIQGCSSTECHEASRLGTSKRTQLGRKVRSKDTDSCNRYAIVVLILN